MHLADSLSGGKIATGSVRMSAPRKPKRQLGGRASSWQSDERGLFVLTSKGPEEVHIQKSLTTDEVWFWYDGHRYLFKRIDIRAHRKYHYHALWLSEEVSRAFSTLAASFMNARFAHAQPAWTRHKAPAIFINGEKIFFLRLSRRYVLIKYQGQEYEFDRECGEVSYVVPKSGDMLPQQLAVGLETVVLMIWDSIPSRTPRKKKAKDSRQLEFNFWTRPMQQSHHVL